MNKKRLLNVAKALRESRHPDDFTMERFVSVCGTPACALGHYAARRDLQRTFRIVKPDECSAYFAYSSGGGAFIDHEEVHQHFGITYGQADRLFGSHGCDGAKTPQEAAEYIEQFVTDSN